MASTDGIIGKINPIKLKINKRMMRIQSKTVVVIVTLHINQVFRKELAQHAEKLGYKRYWLAEHHNMPGIASSATSLLISHVAQATSTIRVGAGGVMLPNHSPLVIAEQFGTLETLYPGRIDLGLGR